MDLNSLTNTEESHRNVTDQHSNLKPVTSMCVSLSNLTAKYNKSKQNHTLFSNEIRSSVYHKEEKYKGVKPGVSRHDSRSSDYEPVSQDNCLNSKSNYLNFDEDESSDSESSGLSLAGLAFKHKAKTNDGSKSFMLNLSKKSSVDTDLIQKFDDFNDNKMAGNKSSLLAVTDNHEPHVYLKESKSESGQGLLTCAGPEFDMIKAHPMKTSEIGTNKTNILNQQGYDPTEAVNKVTSSFIAINFSDDSDSDESFSLSSLVRKHTKSISQPERGSAGDVSHSVSTHLTHEGGNVRQHTKSESDRFSSSTLTPETLIKRDYDNETSASLGSLRSISQSYPKNFQFTLGCSIPGSFRKKHRSDNLASSLQSIRATKSELNSINSFSDPNVSVKAIAEQTLNINMSCKTREGGIANNQFHIPFEGINLSCAIKSSSSTSVSENMESRDNMNSNEQVMDEIVTLLDAESTMEIEDEVTTLFHGLNVCGNTIDGSNIVQKSTYGCGKIEDSCICDASFILKLKLKTRTTKCSSFGNVICKKWRLLQIPYIRKEKLQTTILPFNFSTPSPDDELASFRRRKSFVT